MIRVEFDNEKGCNMEMSGKPFEILAGLCTVITTFAREFEKLGIDTTVGVNRKIIGALKNQCKLPADDIGINAFATDVHKTAVDHGWWEKPQEVPEMIALCHSELSEALEEWRKDMPMLYGTCALHKKDCFAYRDGDCQGDNDKTCKPEGVGAELADCVLRIFDFCAGNNIDLEGILKAKNEYNKTREHKHGGKKI